MADEPSKRIWRTLLILIIVLAVMLCLWQGHLSCQTRVIGYACTEGCGGWADRQKGIVSAFLVASILRKEFKIYMPNPCDIGYYLSPRENVNWKLEPGELVGKNVIWIRKLGHTVKSFIQAFLEMDNPSELFPAEYVLLTTNLELVHLIRRHKLAQEIPWLQNHSIPDIYRYVLTELFDLMPGPRLILEAFQQSLPPKTKLVCAQIRVGGDADTESFNTKEQFSGLAAFLEPFRKTASNCTFMFTSDSHAMIQYAQNYFPSRTVQISGSVVHVDRATGDDVCNGLRRTILEQLVLSTCHVLVISESGLAKIAAFLRNTDESLFIFHDGFVERFWRGDKFPNRIW